MYKTHPTMHPHNAATMVFKSEDDEEDEDDKALVVVFAILSRLAPIGIKKNTNQSNRILLFKKWGKRRHTN